MFPDHQRQGQKGTAVPSCIPTTHAPRPPTFPTSLCGILGTSCISQASRIPNMIHISGREWQMAGLAAFLVVAAGSAVWHFTRKRPTADEIEFERRETLASFGRIVDGMLLDGFKITTEDGQTRNMLLYGYEISGVCYECSQDVTTLAHILDTDNLKLGMPCSIRYQPGSPENSMVVGERWSGLRSGFQTHSARPVDHFSEQLID